MNRGNYNHVVVKVGTSSLCDKTGVLSKEKMLKIVKQVVTLKRKGIYVTIVSSGAIGAGMGVMKLMSKPSSIPQKQALAAIGQTSLMKAYEDLFSLFGMHCGQILVNHADFGNWERLSNLSNTMQAMRDYGIIPIVNENDALTVEEIRVGDNDTLAALMVPEVNADLLVILSDIDGLYNDNPHINKDAKLIKDVYEINETIKDMAKDSSSAVGTGGMITKINAAKMVTEFGCNMAIINSSVEDGILSLIEGKSIGTYFHASKNKLNASLHWLMYRSVVKGKLYLSSNIKDTSIYVSDILNVDGEFIKGQVVELVDKNKKVYAKGVVDLASSKILQSTKDTKVIDENNLVVIS